MSRKNCLKYCDGQRYFRVFIVVIIHFMCLYFVEGEPAVKDKSMLSYANPKYMKNVEVIMFRRRNKDPYKTNITATSLFTWGPNVTTLVSYPLEGGKMFNVSTTGCSSVDKIWLVQLLWQNSNVTECPLLPGTYRHYNLGPVPKVFPSPAPSVPTGSSNTARIEIFWTLTKERIVEIFLHVYVRK